MAEPYLMQKHISAGRLIEPVGLLSRMWKQGRNYSLLVGRLLHSTCEGRTSKLGIITALGLAHLGCQGAAIYAIYWYGRQMERGGTVTVPLLRVSVNFKEQPEWLWAILIFSVASFVASATFLYLARRQILALVEKDYARNVEELVLLCLRIPDPRVRMASELFMRYGMGGLGGGCRYAALTAITFSTAILAAIGGVGATLFLFWIDPSLTLWIFVSVGLSALLLYPLTLRGVQGAKDREKAQVAFKTEVNELAGKSAIEQANATVKSTEELARVFMSRRRVVFELIFAIEIGITVILGLVVYYMAREALAGREQWAIFIAYIASLRMALSGASQPLRAFAGVSRYYPQIVRYYLFSKDMQKIDALKFARTRQGDQLVLGTLYNGEEVITEAGDHLALLTQDQACDLRYALLGAKPMHSTLPLQVVIVDAAQAQADDAGVVLIPSTRLYKGDTHPPTLLEGLRDKVTLIVYQDPERAGMFGEKWLLTSANGSLQRFEQLGTEAAAAAIREFLLKASEKQELRQSRGIFGVDDDEDNDG
jgi:hypothetical protein